MTVSTTTSFGIPWMLRDEVSRQNEWLKSLHWMDVYDTRRMTSFQYRAARYPYGLKFNDAETLTLYYVGFKL